MDKKTVRASVREVVEFSLRSGSIEKGRVGSRAEEALEGIRCHVEFQNIMTDQFGKDDFQSEVYTKCEISNDEVCLIISGRIDGLLTLDDKKYIYEIKSTSKDPDLIGEDEFPVHWAQAECYAKMLQGDNSSDSIIIRLVYINRENRKTRQFERSYKRIEIEDVFKKLTDPFLNWMSGIRNWEVLRNASIRAMEFPFSYYRLGQRELAEKAYISIRDKTRLFVQAPTGIGKTMGTVFPAIKALGEGLIEKIFYLTAKNVTSQIAVDNYKRLAANGLNLRTIVITAKDKVCPLEKRNCDPDFCDRAKGYYDRLPAAMEDLLSVQFMDRDVCKEYADKHNICPFELSLDASLYCDMVIGDYNYLFDPRVRLIRFFEDVGESYCFLVDEAHNLVDRSREMFSAKIEKKKALSLKRITKPAWDDLKKRLENVNKQMLTIKKEYFDEEKDSYAASHDIPGNLVTAVSRCTYMMEFYMDNDMDEEYFEQFMELYFEFRFFLKISEMYDDHYAVFYETRGSDLHVKLMCLDPSKLLSSVMDKGRSTILFSATLSPMNYYKNILGGRYEDRTTSLPSPFPRENLNVAVEGRISTKYRERHSSYEDIAGLLKSAFREKTGNYMVFFPSYRYLRDVLHIYEQIDPDIEIMVQKSGMNDDERQAFLDRFDDHGESTLAAFAVMGGIFGEGIDLTGEKLSGVVIVGTGLPTVCPERELIMNYYNEINGSGFDYAYTYPGLNRVLQAAGRVIRSEYDKGFVVLIDKRFTGFKYRELYPEWWYPEYIQAQDEDVVDYII